jgi:hypothetical protein
MVLIVLDYSCSYCGILAGNGYSLRLDYLISIGTLILLYSLTERYMIYEASNKDNWWLSYL